MPKYGLHQAFLKIFHCILWYKKQDGSRLLVQLPPVRRALEYHIRRYGKAVNVQYDLGCLNPRTDLRIVRINRLSHS